MTRSLRIAFVSLAMVAAFGAGTATATPVVSSDFVLGPTVPGKWGPPAFGTGATVTWSLADADGYSCASEMDCTTVVPLSSFMPAGFKAAIDAAFAAWTAVANITFVEVVDSDLAFDAPGATGDIRIGGHTFDGAGGTLAHGFFPPANGASAAGDLHFDVAETWKLGGETGTIAAGGLGFDIFQVAAHEIGHAIGLNHPCGDPGTPACPSVPGALMDAFYSEAFVGPQADDIAGAVFIYGPAAAVPAPGALLVVALGLLAVAGARSRKLA